MQLGLLPRGVALPAVEAALPLLLHPASCLRLAVVGLVTALAGAYIYRYIYNMYINYIYIYMNIYLYYI
jgi:hypothetical protein